MNLLMNYNDVDVSKIKKTDVKNFEILSQILPPLTIKYKTKLFNEAEDAKTSNNIIEIIKEKLNVDKLKRVFWEPALVVLFIEFAMILEIWQVKILLTISKTLSLNI